jgi:hypothetical protein
MALDPDDLRILFDLATKRQDVKDGWWWKIVVWESSDAPADIRYSLTLHAPDGSRVLGYDNDHQHHHRHPPEGGRIYDFSTCAQLIADFFEDVDRHLLRIGVLP